MNIVFVDAAPSVLHLRRSWSPISMVPIENAFDAFDFDQPVGLLTFAEEPARVHVLGAR